MQLGHKMCGLLLFENTRALTTDILAIIRVALVVLRVLPTKTANKKTRF
jgi:hypothetical protein